VAGYIGTHSDTHPDNGLIDVFDDGVKTRVQNLPPHRMIPCQGYEPCRRMDGATTSLKAAILDHGEEFQPISDRMVVLLTLLSIERSSGPLGLFARN
jgi:hypothetical protein